MTIDSFSSGTLGLFSSLGSGRSRSRPIFFVGVLTAGLLLGSSLAAQLTSSGDLLFSPSNATGGGSAEGGEAFGMALAVGDFDGNGYPDLVIGSPRDRHQGVRDGSIHVLYSSAGGLGTFGNTYLHQGSPGVPGLVEHGDEFGTTLAAGDFNGDGVDDLAIGSWEDWGPTENAGVVTVLYGAWAMGLVTAQSHVIHQDMLGMSDVIEPGDLFGRALAAGDFNGDGRDDLAIGVPAESVGAYDRAGGVHVVYGTPDGLDPLTQRWWIATTPDLKLRVNGQFGYALTAGKFNNDGYWDLAIGYPGGRISRTSAAGATVVAYGGPGGVGSGPSTDFFGGLPFDLVGADFDGNQTDDLAISDFATVRVFSGGAGGLSSLGSVELQISGFLRLAAGNFDGDNFVDLAVSDWTASVGSLDSAGVVRVFDGSPDTVDLPYEVWTQNTGLFNAAEKNDFFGFTLATADFDQDGADELVVGAPGEGYFGLVDVGVVHVIKGQVKPTWSQGGGDLEP